MPITDKKILDRIGYSGGPAGSNEIPLAEYTADESQNPTNPTDTSPSRKLPDFRYPLNLSVSHPGRIVFTSYKIDGLDVGKQLGKAFDFILSSRNALAKSASKEDETNAAKTLTAEEQKSLLAGKSANIQQQTYENLQGGAKQGSVTLPLPSNIVFNDAAVYQSADLGALGGLAESKAGGDSISLADGNLSPAASAIIAQKMASLVGVGLGAGIGAIGGKAGSLLGAVVGSNATDGLEASTQSATRIAISPNERQLFKRVNLRKFAFNFKMIAMSREEAVEIKNIVKFFREEMYPEKIPITEGGLPLAYRYPNVFDIKLQTRTAGNNPAFVIQRCYLENVATTFNSTSPGMYEGDHFIEVDVSLGFTEISVLDKQKIKDGY